MNLFAQIAKVDEEKRLVFGRAAEEAVDKADEIMDYMSSKPHFQKWSADIAADTDGKNLGNVRAMHGKVAAGALTQIDFNDSDKVIDVVAKIVDDNEWKKVLAGVYTGFSIGGSYVGEGKVEKVDGKDVKRYTAKPTEVSLVDRPCMTGAKFFNVQKADGSLVKVDFVEPEEEDDVTVQGTAEDIVELGKLMNTANLDVRGLIAKVWPAEVDFAKLDDAAAKTHLDGLIEKLEADFKDVLTKIGARNSKADQSKVDSIHKMSVELGAKCGGDDHDADDMASKVSAAKALLKAEDIAGKTDDEILKLAAALPKPADPDLQKMVDAALEKAMAPLKTELAAANEKITKLEAQPAPTRVALRAVAKSDDTGNAGPTEQELLAKLQAPIVDDLGDKHDAAGLIKGLHALGGAPLHVPNKR